MNPAKTASFAWSYLFLVFILSGCSFLSGQAGTPTVAPEQVQKTINAMVTLTVAAMPVVPQATHTQTRLETLAPGRTPTPPGPTATDAPPTLTSTPSPTPVCDRAMAGSPIDVTIPDDSLLYPGQPFTKIWRLQNIGICTWNKEYSARFFYGSQMSAPDMVFLIREVLPGESIEIAIDMVAPASPGSYQGNWKLTNNKGQFFGIGPSGDSPFWVQIQVVPAQTTSTATLTITPPPSATPTYTLTPTPQVQASGTLKLAIDSELDLDIGAINPSSGADLSYQKDSAFHILLPLNEAKFGVYGNSNPVPSACQSAAMSTAPITLESLSPGVYLCILSESGRYGWIRYNGIESSSESAMLDFNTWAMP